MAKKKAKKPVVKVKKNTAVKKTVKKARKSNTQIVVKYDCGFDNHLSIRGQGAGLSWYKGVALKNISADEWIFDVVCPEAHIEFKVLINDQVFEIGDNHKVKNGQKIEIKPFFH